MNPVDIVDYTPAPDLLQGRVILVTGAGDGIGKAVALACARHGATVVLLGRTMSKLEAVYDQIEAEGLPLAAIYPLHLESASPEEAQQLHNVIHEEFGLLDGLLHNAGELGARTPIENYNLEDWQKVLAVNTTAPFLLTKFLLPLLRQAKDGRILFTGSSVGVQGRAFWGGYAVSKGASETLMQVVADELEDTTIRVNSINPGATRTSMRMTAYPAEDPNTLITPDQLANRYLFLLGPDSRGVHGQHINAQPTR